MMRGSETKQGWFLNSPFTLIKAFLKISEALALVDFWDLALTLIPFIYFLKVFNGGKAGLITKSKLLGHGTDIFSSKRKVLNQTNYRLVSLWFLFTFFLYKIAWLKHVYLTYIKFKQRSGNYQYVSPRKYSQT